jgi:VIT1/CCC1 family predicted Fe2+/Mn2+ transporter
MKLSNTHPMKASWHEEKCSAYLYQVMAESEPDLSIADMFRALSSEADKQAAIWRQVIEPDTHGLPYIYKPDVRTRLVAWLVRRFGPRKLQPILASMKIRGLSVYAHKSPVSRGHGSAIEARHTGSGNSNGFRAAVFGINDGLVSIACLVMGVAGAASSSSAILLAGLAGLLAGAFSMAAGEYISVRSQREMFEYQIGLERAELAQYPEDEAAELALIYMARGMTETDARVLGQKMVADPEVGLNVLAREELGLNPDDLGSPWMAAISSFLAFSIGGIVPLMPYLVGSGEYQLQMTVLMTSVALFTVGATLSLFTGRSAFKGGARMLLIGGTAGAMTYFVGQWVGGTAVA